MTKISRRQVDKSYEVYFALYQGANSSAVANIIATRPPLA